MKASVSSGSGLIHTILTDALVGEQFLHSETMDSELDMDDKKRKQKIWGALVCFGTIITFIAGIGHVNSFGLIYNDFIIDTHSTAKSLTAAHGVFAVMLAIGGTILNVMSKKYSLRQGGIIGAGIFLIGSFSTIFISNTNQLPVTFGVLQGIGFGMMVPVCYSTLNKYFVERRTTVMSLCKAIQGIVLMGYPYLIRSILLEYGFRGALVIISGISLHVVPGMIAMKDLEPRIKTANKLAIEDGPEHDDLLNGKEINGDERPNRSRGVKLSLELLEMLNVKGLKDLIYCNICLGQSFVNFSDLTFFILQPMLLFQHGFNTAQVTTCISICAGADVAGRCVLVVLSSLVSVNTRLLFYLATLFTLVTRIVMLQVNDFFWVATITGILGILRAWLHVASPLVIASHVSHQEFPGAYAIFMLVTGVVNVLFAPLIGLLKDEYDDFIPAFYALTFCCMPCLIFWPLELMFYRKEN